MKIKYLKRYISLHDPLATFCIHFLVLRKRHKTPTVKKNGGFSYTKDFKHSPDMYWQEQTLTIRVSYL